MAGLLPRGTAAVVGRRLTPEPERPLPRDPARWIRETLGEHLWSKQREILDALQTYRRVAVKACHESSKSFTAARSGAWWIAGHPPGEARIVTTAPSGPQVSSILWAEIEKAHRRGDLPGRITLGNSPRWMIGQEEVGQGRKPADYVDVAKARTGFQGLHARYLLGIIDEADGIPLWLWQAFETMATNETSKLLAIGNPDDPTSHFAKVCAPGSGWHVITISALDTPNFTGEQVPEQLRESLISKRWVEGQIAAYGLESNYVQSKCFGEFGENSSEAIITPRMVREAHSRDLSGKAVKDHGRYGMDVARSGDDETVTYWNRGGMVRLVDAWREGLDGPEAAERIGRQLAPDRLIQVDATGLGWSVFDALNHGDYRNPVQAFEGGRSAFDPTRYENLSTEAWWAVREAMQAGLLDLDPADEVLAAQLQSRKWKETPLGRIAVEKKDAMAKRGVKSPDRADAFVLSVFKGFRVPDPSEMAMQPGEARAPADDLLEMRF